MLLHSVMSKRDDKDELIAALPDAYYKAKYGNYSDAIIVWTHAHICWHSVVHVPLDGITCTLT